LPEHLTERVKRLELLSEELLACPMLEIERRIFPEVPGRPYIVKKYFTVRRRISHKKIRNTTSPVNIWSMGRAPPLPRRSNQGA
jgi:hypothetical protein